MGARHLAWLLGLAACYSPDPPEGAPCQVDEHCPRPQRCLAGACRLSPPGGDAAFDGKPPADGPADAPSDARIDAPSMGCSITNFNCNAFNLISCNGLCFIRCNALVPRAEAASRCAAWGGELAVFDSAEAVTCALTNVPVSWIGLTQSGIAASPASGWTWNGTIPLSFTAWNTAQPDDGDGIENGSEQCGAASGGGWDDIACTGDRGFICRR
jgi:hypothetical protein